MERGKSKCFLPGMEAVAQSVPHTCFSNEHLSLFKSREGKEAFHKSWLREIMLEHGSPLKQWGGGDKCARRWRPGDRCVSFRHYLQGSPGEPGVPGRDGLKGEKVGKPQIKFSPYRKKKQQAVMFYHRENMGDKGWRHIADYLPWVPSSIMLYLHFSSWCL